MKKETNIKKALICGVSGQDGAYLSKFLLSKGYEVWGTSRNPKLVDFHNLKILDVFDKIKIVSMLPENFEDVSKIFSEILPDEVYNLSGQSSVGQSFINPNETISSIIIGTQNQLEAIRVLNNPIRFYNAGSSECFGSTEKIPASEQTQFKPQSPYAIAKAAATWQVEMYRKVYGLFACTGILFNHESPLRGDNFVTKKIVSIACRIQHGSKEKLILGNTNIKRDWGWAPEYVKAMWLILNHCVPEDFIIATGQSQSLKEFVEAVFEEAGLKWDKHVVIDKSLFRNSDPLEIFGNPLKARQILKWKPLTSGNNVPKLMFKNYLDQLQNRNVSV